MYVYMAGMQLIEERKPWKASAKLNHLKRLQETKINPWKFSAFTRFNNILIYMLIGELREKSSDWMHRQKKQKKLWS